ncbi:MAG: hypothetical protein ACYS8X_11515 [Planctomycetota bacterium]|jgi:hypothetical protein
MKSQRRHELQHNVLDTELGKTIDFFRQNGLRLIGVFILVGVLAFLGFKTLRRMRERPIRLEARLSELVRSPSLTLEERVVGLEELVDDGGSRLVAAQACLALGNIHLQEAMAGTSPTGYQELCQKADTYFARAVESFADQPIMVAKGYVGRGIVAENLGNFEAAKEHFGAAVAVEGAAHTPVTREAMEKRDAVASLEEPVEMTSAPALPEPGTLPDPGAFDIDDIPLPNDLPEGISP